MDTTVRRKYREKIVGKQLPEEVESAIEKELDKLASCENYTSYYDDSINYLDLLTDFPWGQETTKDLSSTSMSARSMYNCVRLRLDNAFIGMRKIKDLVFEYLITSHNTGKAPGRVICLHGPAGVGKTFIAKSIASELGREFTKINVAGLSDVCELKGLGRSYTGAKPGKIVSCIKNVKSINPVIMIDKVDKIGHGWKDDPLSALVEIFDQELNSRFNDDYLEVPIDLSRVIFICTAYSADKIPDAVKDYMEIIDVGDYTENEKLAIAQKYLIPAVKVKLCVPGNQISFSVDALNELITRYCRESGVKDLQKYIEIIMRKVYVSICTSYEEPGIHHLITKSNLNLYVEQPNYCQVELYDNKVSEVSQRSQEDQIILWALNSWKDRFDSRVKEMFGGDDRGPQAIKRLRN